MKILKYIFIVFCTSLTFSGLAQDKLNAYLKTAAENNPELKAKFYEYRSSLERITQVGSLPDPKLTFAYFIEPINTATGPQQLRLGFTQMFPWFGTLNTKENIETLNAKAKYQEFLDLKLKLFFKVKSAYFDLYFTKKAIKIAQENMILLKSLKEMTMIKIESNKTKASDGLRIDMEINDIEYNIEKLKDLLFIQSVKFNKLLNQNTNAEIIIPDTLQISVLKHSKNVLKDSILKSNLMLAKFDYRLKSLHESEKLSRKNAKPDFSIGLEYISINNTENLSGKDAFIFPKLSVGIPLYSKKYKSMTEEVVLKQNSVEFQRKDFSNKLITAFEQTYIDLEDAERRIRYYQEQKDLASKTLKLLKYEYISNKVDFEELLIIEKKYLKYNLDYEKAITDKQIAIAYINYLTSK